MVEGLACEGQAEGIGGRNEVDDLVEELMTEVQKWGRHEEAGADADGLGRHVSHDEKMKARALGFSGRGLIPAVRPGANDITAFTTCQPAAGYGRYLNQDPGAP